MYVTKRVMGVAFVLLVAVNISSGCASSNMLPSRTQTPTLASKPAASAPIQRANPDDALLDLSNQADVVREAMGSCQSPRLDPSAVDISYEGPAATSGGNPGAYYLVGTDFLATIYDQSTYWEVGVPLEGADPWSCGAVIHVDKVPALQGFKARNPQGGIPGDFQDFGSGVAVKTFSASQIAGTYLDGCLDTRWNECSTVGAVEFVNTGVYSECPRVSLTFDLTDGSGTPLGPDVIDNPQTGWSFPGPTLTSSHRVASLEQDSIAAPDEGFVIRDAICTQ